MFDKSSEIEIILEAPDKTYTNGDLIEGIILLHNKKPRSVHGVRAYLQCEELASVTVNNNRVSYEDTDRKLWLDQSRVVFPTDEMQALGTRSDDAQTFTLQVGDHAFPFNFTIPVNHIDLPASCRVNSKSWVVWYVGGEVDQPTKLISRKKSALVRFQMTPSISQFSDIPGTQEQSVHHPVSVYLPGYAEWRHTVAAKFRFLVPRLTKFCTHTSAKVTVIVPQCGIFPNKAGSVGADVHLELSEPQIGNLVCIRGVSCHLQQNFLATVGHEFKQQQENSFKHTLVSINHVNWEFKEGCEKIREAVYNCRVSQKLPPTRTNNLIDVSYKFVVVILLASKEWPDHPEELETAANVRVQPLLAQRNNEFQMDELPVYTQLNSVPIS